MLSAADIAAQTGAHAWLYLPVAVLLGVLHGLEPGHSKTMMAAFIIAVRGTVTQAVLLGLAAALSHTAIVWLVALGGQAFLRGSNAEGLEPYFQIASAVLVFTIAAWMLWRASPAKKMEASVRTAHLDTVHDHNGHGHSHATDIRRIDTGHGCLALEIFEEGVPPRWRIRFEDGHAWAPADVKILTRRPGGVEQNFAFSTQANFLESVEEIPEPHAFEARVSLGHGSHVHAYDLAFVEENHGPKHEHASPYNQDRIENEAMNVFQAASTDGDAHQRAHAQDIARRFPDRNVTTAQIVLFGLTGGLVPCPAAITVLLLCLQLKRFALAVALVFCFSAGVAATMVAAGVIAALGVRHVRARWSGFDKLASRAPYASGMLMIVVSLYMGLSGWLGLPPHPAV